MKKLIPLLLLALSGAASVAIWSEASSASIYARQDMLAAKRSVRESALPAKDRDARLRKLDWEFAIADDSFTRITFLAVASVLFSGASCLLLLRAPKPNQTLEPARPAVTSPAGAGAAPAAHVAHL